jgi:hypothetical protein
VQCGGPAGQGHGVLHPHPVGQLPFEGVDVRSDRRDPVRVERLQQHAAFLGAHLGRREEDAAHVDTPRSGARAPEASASRTNDTAATTSTVTAAGVEWRCAAITTPVASTASTAT